MDTVWVIVGSRGEYSDRCEWVAGVFTDKAAAISLAEEKLRASKAADALHAEWIRCMRATPGYVFLVPFTEEQEARVLKCCGPYPPDGDADDYTVIEVPLNEWGRFANQ